MFKEKITFCTLEDYDIFNHVFYLPEGLKIIDIRNATVYVPRRMIILPGLLVRPDKATAVGIVKVYDPEGMAYPQFVFVTDRDDANSFPAEEINAVLDACSELCPQFAQLKDPASTAKVGISLRRVQDEGKVISLFGDEFFTKQD